MIKTFVSRVLVLMTARYIVALLAYVAVVAPVSAWSPAGHQWVGHGATEQLPVRVQKYYQALLKEGVVVPPRYYHATLPERLGALSAWPEGELTTPLTALYKKTGASSVPNALLAYADQTVGQLRQSPLVLLNNNGGPLSDGKCFSVGNNALSVFWPALLKAYNEAGSGREKNVTLALALYIAAEVYQPLNFMALMDSSCKVTRAPADICILKGGTNETCKANLYQVWDNGFSIFKQPPGWPAKQHPLNFLAFDDAVGLAKSAAFDVFPANGNYQTPEYVASGKKVTLKAVDYAVGHSVFLLKYLMANDVSWAARETSSLGERQKPGNH